MRPQTSVPRENRPGPFAKVPIIHFGVACCALAMAIVVAVAIAATG